MAYLHDDVLDKGLEELRLNAQTIHACSSEPASFAAVAGASLGSTSVTAGAIADRAAGGREVTCTPQAGATYATGGTATHYAIVDDTNSRLLATNALAASKAVNAGDAVTIDPLAIGFPDAVSA
ncbi:hypothetical protein [Limimaricola pyoseonensis]|uniref:Uncharacterized protein n=1 Tax=Limimaricola pyoseonensis TaxID=521013 RepID=A0A1G7GP29_9RHOB|nr:hypothetical protein [Limimaricola pyoseonensis]SDE89749.1 hypothetical protein SAMN04488567_2860 [Limimaricola pyoseonensis]